MRLNVIDMPEYFPARDATGHALSVHARVINLALDGDHAGPSLVTVDARNNAPLSPGTVRLKAPKNLDFSHMVRPGASVAIRSGILRISAAELAIDFRDAAPVRWNGGPVRPKQGKSVLAAGWVDAWSLLVERADPSGFTTALVNSEQRSRFDRALARRVRTAVPGLMQASAKADLQRARDFLRRLLGTGPGLTPSGDDFATGYFLGLGQVFREPNQLKFLRGLTQAAVAQSLHSTDVSRAYLAHAAAGRFSEPLTNLVGAILSRDENLPARLTDLLSMGHSSGRDAAFGVMCGLAVNDPHLHKRVASQLNNVHLQENTAR